MKAIQWNQEGKFCKTSLSHSIQQDAVTKIRRNIDDTNRVFLLKIILGFSTIKV